MENIPHELPNQEISSLEQPQNEVKTSSKFPTPKIFIVMAAVVLAMILGFGGILAIKKSQNSSHQVSNSLPTTTIAPTYGQTMTSSFPKPTANSTGADWKTYSNPSHKVSFAYPTEFSVQEQDNGSQQFIVTIQSPQETFKLDIQPTQQFSNIMSKAKTSLTFNGFSWGVVAPSKYCDAGQCSDTYPEYVTSQNGFDYQFIVNKQISPSNINAILNTFKFSNQTNDSANWKTYANTQYGFSMQYPNTLKLYEPPIPSLYYIPICDSQQATGDLDSIVCLVYSDGSADNPKITPIYNPNFSAASVSVVINKDENTQIKCNQFGNFQYYDPISTEKINNVTFYKTTFGQGATGHEIESKYYQTFYNNTCFEIKLNLESTSPNVYPTQMPQSDKDKIFTLLNQILFTFHFTK